MKKKSRDSKMNVTLTVMLVFFVCLLSFSVGVISGKGLSDREYALRTIEGNSQYAKKMLDEEGDNSPLSEDMTEKEVELLTAKALEEARKNPEVSTNEAQEIIAEIDQLEQMEKQARADKVDNLEEKSNQKPMQRNVATSDKPKKEKRDMASIPKATTPKPSSIEYTVQVASYKTMQEAENHSQKLIDKGFPAFPVKANVKGTMWYRVSVGSFKNRNSAMKYQKDLKKQAMVRNSIVQKVLRQ